MSGPAGLCIGIGIGLAGYWIAHAMLAAARMRAAAIDNAAARIAEALHRDGGTKDSHGPSS